MALRDEAHLIVAPGSQKTLIQFGIEDNITPPKYQLPTRVYRNPGDPSLFQITEPEGGDKYAVYPIVKGEIKDVDALNFLFKVIVKSLLKDDPLILLDSISFTLVQTCSKWSSVAVESITNYVFETLQLGGFAVVPAPLCSMFAFGSLPNACVVDIGYEKSEVSPIIDFQVYSPAVVYLAQGGASVNAKLRELLPSLTDDQIEELKKSEIFEQLSEEDAKASFFGIEGLKQTEADPEEEGILDIAAIVTSEKSTREILEEKERAKKEGAKKDEPTKPNSELETNIFVDSQGNTITVGKERFQGCRELIESLCDAIYLSLSKVHDEKRRQECYDNLVICGQTSAIQGFKEELLVKLYTKYAIGGEMEKKDTQNSAFRNESTALLEEVSLTQAPKRIRLVPRPDYFSEWKKVGWEDCVFLGGEILCRQIFGGSSNQELYLSKEDYKENGPMGIWHVTL